MGGIHQSTNTHITRGEVSANYTVSPNKDTRHCRLWREEGWPDFNSFFVQIFQTQLATKRPFKFPPHPASAHLGKSEQAKYYILIQSGMII